MQDNEYMKDFTREVTRLMQQRYEECGEAGAVLGGVSFALCTAAAALGVDKAALLERLEADVEMIYYIQQKLNLGDVTKWAN